LTSIWLGFDFIVLGIARIRGFHRIFGKRFNGQMPLWSWLIFLPLHVGTLTVWNVARLLSQEPAFGSVTEHLVVGRRLLASETAGNFDNYVDLAAELPGPSIVRRSSAYFSFPIIDGAAPAAESLKQALVKLGPGRTYIHCALGHGRTGLFALAMLLKSGEVATVEEGLRRLRAVRPGIRLNKDQAACIKAFAKLDRSAH
jgi:hypothetical protein